jgi:DNA-binding HxlR family transcriptional regulator
MNDSEHPASVDQCPVELSARIIGQKWTLQIVNHLIHDRTLRFCELQEALGGVNPSTLSSRLKMLEEEGIVLRRQRSTVPPHVEYSLTPKGKSLEPIISAVRRWGNRWLCSPDAGLPVESNGAVKGMAEGATTGVRTTSTAEALAAA